MAVKGSCHCGAIQFTVDEAPTTATRCTCSYCSKRGALWAYYKPEQVKLTTDPDRVSLYQWGSRTIKHQFCGVCGCSAFQHSPSWVDFKPDFENMKVSINIRLLDDFDVEAVPIEVIDGKNLW